MDTFRYILAVFLMIGLPPGLLLWFAIHPFASSWRKIGPKGTYTVLAVPVLAVMVALYLARGWLLAVEHGTNWLLVGLGVLCIVAGAIIARKRSRYLTKRILAGIPELSADDPGVLLQEGIYARIRHPRYIEALFWVLGYALISNYLAAYVVFAITLPTIYLIVLLEERELHDRFGEEYEAYCQRVPRFIPRRNA